MTLAHALNPEGAASLAEMRERMHYDQMMAKPVLTLDRMRGHLAASDGKRIQPETAEAIRLVDKSYWTIMHERDARAATNKSRKRK
jgi:hypothetical protein